MSLRTILKMEKPLFKLFLLSRISQFFPLIIYLTGAIEIKHRTFDSSCQTHLTWHFVSFSIIHQFYQLNVMFVIHVGIREAGSA